MIEYFKDNIDLIRHKSKIENAEDILIKKFSKMYGQ